MPKTMTKKPKKIGDWTTYVSHALVLRKGSRKLIVGLTSAGEHLWGVIALETDAKLTQPQAVLDQHAHELIATDLPFAQAVMTAEDYARAWTPNKKADCACDEISHPSARPARASGTPKRQPRNPPHTPRTASRLP